MGWRRLVLKKKYTREEKRWEIEQGRTKSVLMEIVRKLGRVKNRVDR